MLNSNLPAALLTLLGFFIFCLGDSIVKFLAHVPPLTFLSAFALCQASWAGMLALVQERQVSAIKGASFVGLGQLRHHLVFACLALVTNICNVIVLKTLPLASFYIIVFTAPFLTAIAARFLLNEPLPLRAILAILLGFGGVVLAIGPQNSGFPPEAGLALLGTACFVVRNLYVRTHGKAERGIGYMFYGSILMFLMSLPLHLLYPEHGALNSADLPWLILMGACGALGTICCVKGLQLTQNLSLIAPLHYSQIVWGTALGAVFFQEWPVPTTFIGAAVVIFSGLMVLLPSTKKKPGEAAR